MSSTTIPLSMEKMARQPQQPLQPEQPATSLVDLLRGPESTVPRLSANNGNSDEENPHRPCFADLLSPKPTYSSVAFEQTPPPSSRKHISRLGSFQGSPRTPPPMPRRRPRPQKWAMTTPTAEEKTIQPIPDPPVLSSCGEEDDHDDDLDAIDRDLLECFDDDDDDGDGDDIWSRLCLPDPPRPTLGRRRRRQDSYDAGISCIISAGSSVEDGDDDAMFPPSKKTIVGGYDDELESRFGSANATAVGPRVSRNISRDEDHVGCLREEHSSVVVHRATDGGTLAKQWICRGEENDKLIRLIEVDDDDEADSIPMDIDEHWSN